MMAVHEKYKLVQQTWSEEEDWWQWKVWIEAEEKDLNKIEAVEYTLHSTFSNPVRTVRERATHFALEEEGWGGFTLYAKVILTDGTTIPLEHNLTLQDADGQSAGPHTKGLSHHKVKTLAAPSSASVTPGPLRTAAPVPAPMAAQPPRRKFLGKTVAIGASVGVVVLATILFFSVSDDSYADAYSTDVTAGTTDTASFYPDNTATAAEPGESMDTLDNNSPLNSQKRPELTADYRKIRSKRTQDYKATIDSTLLHNPRLWIDQLVEEINQRDRKIYLLQKELDSLKGVKGFKRSLKQGAGSIRQTAPQQ